MLLPPEAFLHVPALAGKVLEPEKSALRLTPERLEELDRIARENGYGENWRLSDEEREATRTGLLAGRNLAIRPVDLGAKGTWYRVVLPVDSFPEATQTCASLKANGVDCVPIGG